MDSCEITSSTKKRSQSAAEKAIVILFTVLMDWEVLVFFNPSQAGNYGIDSANNGEMIKSGCTLFTLISRRQKEGL